MINTRIVWMIHSLQLKKTLSKALVYWKRLLIPARNNPYPFTFHLTAVICSFIIVGSSIAVWAGQKTLVHLLVGKFPAI